jgi:glycosyltransferase involved in cell wall biosynthesis
MHNIAGISNERQMCERFLKSNAFVSSSIIENESNSLSEAKILGIPCIAPYIGGGVASKIMHMEDSILYQMDAPYMLAYFLNEIFFTRNWHCVYRQMPESRLRKCMRGKKTHTEW